MELKIKLQKPTNKKQEEKRKLRMKNGRNSDDKLYTINYQVSRWQMEKSYGDREGSYKTKLKTNTMEHECPNKY